MNPANWPVRDRRVSRIWLISWGETGPMELIDPTPKRRSEDGWVQASKEPCPCEECAMLSNQPE